MSLLDQWLIILGEDLSASSTLSSFTERHFLNKILTTILVRYQFVSSTATESSPRSLPSVYVTKLIGLIGDVLIHQISYASSILPARSPRSVD